MWIGWSSLAAVAALGVGVDAVNLFAASYSGLITTLSLDRQGSAFTLKSLSTTTGAAPSPSWLLLDGGLLYCIDEGLDVSNGSVNVFRIEDGGVLRQTSRIVAPDGGVNGAFFANRGALAVAHYDGSAVSTYLTSNNSQSLIRSQTFDFTLPALGPNPDRQEAPHPHEAIVDPTGNYVLVPDLGADLVRVFHVDKITKQLTIVDPLVAAPGSGPRHAVFGKFPRGKRHRDDAGQGLFLYLVAELANSVTVYEASYLPHGAGMKFEQVQVTDTFAGKPIPPGAGAGEIALSPCGSQILISNRHDNSFGNASDSLATYSIDPAKGTLTPIDLFPAGGPVPRQFALNKAGDLVAVGLQGSGKVVVWRFDESTGKFGDMVAQVDVGGQVVCVIWDE